MSYYALPDVQLDREIPARILRRLNRFLRSHLNHKLPQRRYA